MALPLLVRGGKAGWQEPAPPDARPPAEDKPPQRSACQVSWGWTERWLLITCSVTRRQTRGIIFITPTVSFFFFYSGAAQTLTAGLILRFDDEARLWSVSMGSLKNGAGKTAPSDSSSGLVPECCRQTHKWHMMIINTPIRHLLRFRGCLENNVFTIKRRAQMSKEAHIIPLNGRRSTGRRTRVRRVDQSPVIVL